MENKKEIPISVCENLLEYISKNAYPDLQITIDLLDDTEYITNKYISEEYEDCFQQAEEFGSMAYKIDNVIEAMEYDRKSDFTCRDLEILKTLYKYTNKLSNLVKEFNNL